MLKTPCAPSFNTFTPLSARNYADDTALGALIAGSFSGARTGAGMGGMAIDSDAVQKYTQPPPTSAGADGLLCTCSS